LKKRQSNFVAKLAGLKPGVHAIHIHEKSDCSAADGSSLEDIEPNL
jgi:Cu-Zn family superoxide dismutase